MKDDLEFRVYLKEKVARVLSEILSEKYDCKITLHIEKKDGEKDVNENQGELYQ